MSRFFNSHKDWQACLTSMLPIFFPLSKYLGLWFVCLVCCEFFFPLEHFPLIFRHHHCQWSAANLDLCSALMVIEQWGFISAPLWHGASVYNGYLWGPVTLTPNAERMAVNLSLPVLTTEVCRGWDSNTQTFTWEVNVLTHCGTAAALSLQRLNMIYKKFMKEIHLIIKLQVKGTKYFT